MRFNFYNIRTIFMESCNDRIIFSLRSPLLSDAHCVYNGGSYPIGDTFPASDGCNNCLCAGAGNVSCTSEQDCPPVCDVEGKRHAQGAEWVAEDG